MTWNEFRDKVEQALAEQGYDGEVEFWSLDPEALEEYADALTITVSTFKDPKGRLIIEWRP